MVGFQSSMPHGDARCQNKDTLILKSFSFLLWTQCNMYIYVSISSTTHQKVFQPHVHL